METKHILMLGAAALVVWLVLSKSSKDPKANPFAPKAEPSTNAKFNDQGI